jgi:outer membrane immunogenic protein
MKRLGLGLLTSALAAAACVQFAHAADLPVAPVAPAPAYYRPALYDWTGFYVGGHVGAGLLQDTYTSTTTTPLQSAGSATSVTTSGFVGGAQAGFNYEFAPWVVGVEGSYTWTNLDGSTIAPTLESPAANERSRSTPNWFAAATGRVGYAADTLLIYAKGGVAWMGARYREDVLNGGGVTASSFSVNNTRTGFVVGAGLEYGFVEGWSGKIEYDFYDFGTSNYVFNVVEPVGGTGVVQPVSIQSYVHTFTVGLNYRFNWAGGRPY